jgi:hypothetical protein
MARQMPRGKAKVLATYHECGLDYGKTRFSPFSGIDRRLRQAFPAACQGLACRARGSAPCAGAGFPAAPLPTARRGGHALNVCSDRPRAPWSYLLAQFGVPQASLCLAPPGPIMAVSAAFARRHIGRPIFSLP